jgi:hypothetical protein
MAKAKDAKGTPVPLQAEGRILSATVSRAPSGKHYVSVLCTGIEIAPLPKTGKSVGIDLGLATYATTSDGMQIVKLGIKAGMPTGATFGIYDQFGLKRLDNFFERDEVAYVLCWLHCCGISSYCNG